MKGRTQWNIECYGSPLLLGICTQEDDEYRVCGMEDGY